MKNDWQRFIIQNFDEASSEYNKGAVLQKFFAHKLVAEFSNREVLPGLWVDLGSGTGLLANELETINPKQTVLRIDASSNMLQKHHLNKSTKLFDLNFGLPYWHHPPTLIASSFALHWLKEPEQRLKEWFSALAPGGWLAIVLPVKGSFPEWYDAARKAKVTCTAMQFPSHKSILNVIKKENIHFQQLESFTQEAQSISSLLKPLVQIGAQASPHNSLKISEWRKLQKSWEPSKQNPVLKLTWLIQVLIAKK